MTALAHWLWRLLPANPILVRIVQGASRRPRDLWLRMGYLGILMVLVLVGLLSGGGLGGEVSLTQLAKAGTWVFAFVSYGQVVLICLLAPLFMAGAISQEQTGQTFDILLTTPLSNLQIVLGLLWGRLFMVLALLASGLPLFAVLLIFGGVPISSVFVALAVAALTALVVGAVAVTLAVLRQGGRKAVYVFILVVGGYLVAVYAVDLLLRAVDRARVQAAAGAPTAATGRTTAVTALHPLLVLESAINSVNYAPPEPQDLAHLPWPLRFYLGRPLATYVLLTLLVSTALTLGSALRLRKLGEGEPGGLRALGRRMLGLGPSREGHRRAPRSVWNDPVAWREANARARRRGALALRVCFAAVGVALAAGLLLLYHHGRLPRIPVADSPGQFHTPAQVFHAALLVLLLLEVGLIVLAAIYLSAGCVSREREEGTLDLLLTTPVTPRQYIWGKLRGLVSFLSLMLATPVLTLLLVAAYTAVGTIQGWPQARPEHRLAGGEMLSLPLLLPEAALLLPLMLVPFVALCVAVGMTWSIKSRGVLGAVAPSVGVVALLSLVLGFCGQFAVREIPYLGMVVNAFSPATNLGMLIDPLGHEVAGFDTDPTAGRIALGLSALAAGGGYALFVWLMIRTMVSTFDHTVRRLTGTAD